jgi:fumarate reductase iron-sulfur subunit
MAPESISLEVFRYLPDEDDANKSEGYFQTYEVPYNKDWVVLDALNHIKNHMDGTLSFRWSCRMGVCGSCGMMVNGVAFLTCAAFLRDYLPGPIRREPLSYFPVIRDLVIDMEGFMERLNSVSPWLIREEEKPLEEGEYLQSPAELASYKQFSMCINCMLCYAACPVTGIEKDFVGPAALALAHRYNQDSRDEGFEQRREAIFSHNAIWDCTFVGECSEVCPKDVDPAAAIQQLKLDATKDWFASKLMPWRGNK